MAFRWTTWDQDDGTELPSSFTTRAQDAERRGARRRILWAVVISLATLLVFILLGPDADTVKKRFEYYGVKDELRIMPEISIDDGRDQVHQLPKSLMTPPPPSVIEIEPEELSETGTELVNQVTDQPVTEVLNDVPLPNPDAEIASHEQVELSLPQQSNPDWYIIFNPRPEYPLTATEEERRLPVVFVNVAIFVGPDGLVSEAMIQATNGSRVFADEVLERVRKWEFGWRVPPGAGRWISMTWNFKSPYFTGSRD